jgi:excisionase family DNA binding protein
MEKGFTVKSASEYIGVSPNTIYNMIEDGRLRAVMKNGNYIINTLDVTSTRSVKEMSDEEKDILKISKATIKKAKEELKFKASRVFSEISYEIDKFNNFMENEHADDMAKANELFDEAMENNSPDISDINEKLIKLLDRPYEMKGEIIINLKKIIDGYYEKYIFIKQLEEFYRYVKNNSMSFNDQLEFNKIISSPEAIIDGLKTGKIVIDTKRKRW